MSKKTSRSLILGLGQTGLSLFNYLIKFEQEPIIFDTRDDPPCKKELFLFCAGGLRSALAAKSLKDMGFKNVSHVDGGFGAIKDGDFEII